MPPEESLGSKPPIKRRAKTDQIGCMARLIRVFAGRTGHLLVLLCSASSFSLGFKKLVRMLMLWWFSSDTSAFTTFHRLVLATHKVLKGPSNSNKQIFYKTIIKNFALYFVCIIHKVVKQVFKPIFNHSRQIFNFNLNLSILDMP